MRWPTRCVPRRLNTVQVRNKRQLIGVGVVTFLILLMRGLGYEISYPETVNSQVPEELRD